jgi:hypothetical protein
VVFGRRAALPIAPPGLIPSGLAGPAHDQFHSALAEFAKDVYDEAQRLEAQQNITGGVQEITGAVVMAAASRVRDPFVFRRRRTLDVFLYLTGAAAAIALGVVSNQLDKGWAPVTAIGLAAVVLSCGFISFMRGQ